MERTAINNLYDWKKNENRKPLIIRGARQVGKTWLMKEFGRKEYAQTAYVNFESSKILKDLFSEDYNITRIVNAIQIETGVQINANDTLIILDEIQEAKGGIASLKYFYENTPEYHIIAAGSLLGVSLHQHTSFPVGKVDFLDLYPLSFPEYLKALNQEPLLKLIESQDWGLIRNFKTKFTELLRQYYFTGGMPEVVLSFKQNMDYTEVRKIQKNILLAYEQDFSKHAPVEIVPRIRMLWNSTLAQLAKENKKFIYSAIKKGARAKDFELPLSWLTDSGLIYKVNRINKAGMPLKAYEDMNAFKIFIVDVGLLAAIGNLDVKTLLDGNSIFEEFNGALTEQFVLQQLKTIPDIPIYYWSAEKANAEIDFVIQHLNKIVPIEVKAAENLQAKSLKSFKQRFPESVAIRTSMSDFRKEDWLTNTPLYAINYLMKITGI
ncbi:ATP-binding protein [Plebeiibacterium marinum]|uniref:ATP-binding protein n=1 Tax=Plebeiibacterium marinum TaxID=2992111 RepID=A0AAE3MFA9_9BACT|nr:ATP-binding protein [Plebeiobacterium marinum]MCW3806788.1 ATP-binding protein [Plebeiobacterium marinum]